MLRLDHVVLPIWEVEKSLAFTAIYWAWSSSITSPPTAPELVGNTQAKRLAERWIRKHAR
jgi:hypothetical protein